MSIKSSERNFARCIDLTSLQLFVAVCELGSIGKAAMCRMIANGLGLGVGVIPRRAFELTHGASKLLAIELLDDWATRHIELVARDFSTLPVTARLLVEHLTSATAS